MSQISTAYDALVTRIGAVLTTAAGWTRLPNPYEVSANNDQFLRMGWGIRLGPASIQSGVHCHYRTEREFTIVISREAMLTDSDYDAISSVEKQLTEDLKLLIQDTETQQTLNTGTIFCKYAGDTGVQLVGGQQAYLFLEAQFVIQLVENYIP